MHPNPDSLILAGASLIKGPRQVRGVRAGVFVPGPSSVFARGHCRNETTPVAQPSDTADGGCGDGSPASSRAIHSRRSLWLGWTIAATVLAPTLLAVWIIPGFMTQDGPTHLYNAWILTRSFDAQSPYHDSFVVQWLPLPNWSGHLILACLLRVVSPWSADRIMISLTLVGFAASLVWLRWRIRDDAGIAGASVLAALLAVNFLWLLGFSSFLLGCCLFPITLGVWWPGRDQPEPRRLAGLAVLLVLGYFGHLVSLGLTVVGMGFPRCFPRPRA